MLGDRRDRRVGSRPSPRARLRRGAERPAGSRAGALHPQAHRRRRRRAPRRPRARGDPRDGPARAPSASSTAPTRATPALSIERGRLAIYAHDYDGAAALLARPDLAGHQRGRRARRHRPRLRPRHGGHGRGPRRRARRRRPPPGRRGPRARPRCSPRRRSRSAPSSSKDLGVELRAPAAHRPRARPVHARRDDRPAREGGAHHGHGGRRQVGARDHDLAARDVPRLPLARHARPRDDAPRALAGHARPRAALAPGGRGQARGDALARSRSRSTTCRRVDTVALVGMEKGLGRSLDRLGPSIAMLPTAEEAAVAFAEVHELHPLLDQGGRRRRPPPARRAPEGHRSRPTTSTRPSSDVSGVDLAGWDKRWRAHLAAALARAAAGPGARRASCRTCTEIAKRVRLGELLGERGHHQAAAIELAARAGARPGRRGGALLARRRAGRAAATGRTPRCSSRRSTRCTTASGAGGRCTACSTRSRPPTRSARSGSAVALDPLDRDVACEEKAAPELPSDPLRAAICEAARRAPR